MAIQRITVKPSVCISIVADGQKYTAMADLLIRSIAYFHAEDEQTLIVVGIPEDSKNCEELMSLNLPIKVVFQSIPASPVIDERRGQPYRHFNKITLLEKSIANYPLHHHLFLDSDICLTRRLPFSYLTQFPIAAIPVHYYGWHGDWSRLYADLGFQIDQLSVSSSGYQVGPSYYNAGFVWVHADYASRFSWSKRALQIANLYSGVLGMNLFPWLDQLSLPFAARDTNQSIYELPESMCMFVDKVLVLSEPRSGSSASSYSPRKPFSVHYHGNITLLTLVLKRLGIQLPEHESALELLISMFKNGSLTANKQRSAQRS